jgi:hypothetical protein
MAKMNTAQRKLLKEAIRRGVDFANGLEAKLVSYGRWLVESVFAGDVSAALDQKTSNPVWLELIARAEGPSFPVSKKLLYTALRIAAQDARINDPVWLELDAGRKELLLPLQDEKLLRRAARHVTRFKLTYAKTIEYVNELRATDKRAPRVSAPVLIARMQRFRVSFGSTVMLRRVRRAHFDPAERQALASAIEEVRGGLKRLARELHSS